MLKDIRIRTKLFLGLFIMAVLSVGVMLIGQYGVSRLNDEVRSMHHDRLLPTRDFVELKANLLESRLILLGLINEASPEKQAAARETLASLARSIDDTLERHISSDRRGPAQRAKLLSIRTVWGEFKRTRDQQIVPLILRGRKAEASAIAKGVQARRFERFSRDSAELVGMITRDAVAGQARAESLALALRWKLPWISLTGILLALLLDVMIVRSIAASLEKATDGALRIADGDLSPGEALIESEDEIGVLGKAFNRMRQRLQDAQRRLVQSEKMSAVGKLSAGIAHEINNPLGVILGYAQALARGVQPGDPLEEPLRAIERESLRCKKLVADLLVFSRSSADGRGAMDLNGAIEGALRLVEAGGALNLVRIEKDLDADVPRILGDANKIQQIVINLANNAIDAMPEGGVLRISTRACPGHPLSWAVLTVSDTGNGIPEDIQTRVFDPFFTTKALGKGTGLGLSLVYELVQKHSGAIELSSRPGRTEFSVRFPIR